MQQVSGTDASAVCALPNNSTHLAATGMADADAELL
jgi:hypothetical protein